jgi:hypothetical protein
MTHLIVKYNYYFGEGLGLFQIRNIILDNGFLTLKAHFQVFF